MSRTHQGEHNGTPVQREREGSPVSIIIPVFNQLEYTEMCLETLARNTPPELHEVIVVDNGSTDRTCEFLSRRADDIRVVTNDENLGFAKACNQGARAGRSSKYLLFLNNDVEVGANWLEPLIDVLDRDSSVGAVGSRLLFPDGTIQHAGVVIFLDRKLPEHPLGAFHNYYQKPGHALGASQPRTYQAVTAACLLVRTAAFEQVGGFDEGYWNGFEDVDFCFKLQRKGWKLVYQPQSTSIHHESKSGPERFARVGDNEIRLNRRWRGKIQPDFVFEPNGSVKRSPAGQIQSYSSPSIEFAKERCEPPDLSRVGVSIVILTRDQLEYTKMCLESIREHTPERHEIIVVDNGSTDGTVKHLASDSQIKLIRNQENLGFPAACNQGIRESAFPYVLLLNNDTVVTEGWLRGLLECVTRAPHIGVAGPCSNYVAGPQLIQGLHHKDLAKMHRYARDFREKNRGRWLVVPTVKGFCMLIKKEVIERVGLLDERFGLGNYEDDDFCLMAKRAGFRAVVAQDVFVHHFGSKTFSGSKVDYEALSRKNQQLFDEKWSPGQSRPVLKPVLSVERLAEKATGLVEERQYEQAEQLLMEGLSQHKEAARLLGLLKEIYIRTSRWKEAKETLELLLEKDFSNPEVNFSLGQIAQIEQRFGEAERYYRKVLKQDSKNPEVYNQLGTVYQQTGVLDQARDCYGKALLLKQDYPEAWFNKGMLLQSIRQEEEAIQCLERSLDLDTNNPLVHSTIGQIYLDRGEREKGLIHLEASLALAPDQPQLRLFFQSISGEAWSHDEA